jgi:hypothetical protein
LQRPSSSRSILPDQGGNGLLWEWRTEDAAVFKTRCFARDPSLRLKNGSAQDDAEVNSRGLARRMRAVRSEGEPPAIIRYGLLRKKGLLLLAGLRHVHGNHLPFLAALLKNGRHADLFGFVRNLHFDRSH